MSAIITHKNHEIVCKTIKGIRVLKFKIFTHIEHKGKHYNCIEQIYVNSRYKRMFLSNI